MYTLCLMQLRMITNHVILTSFFTDTNYLISIWYHIELQHTLYSKNGRHQTRGSNSVNSIIKIIFTVRFSIKFAAQCLLKSPPHLICIAILPRETLTSENERQSQTNAVINDKLLGTVVTHLRCGEIFNNQIKKGLLPSLQVKLF